MTSRKIISWNVNSLHARYNDRSFLHLLEKENPDIVCLQETKVTESGLDNDLKKKLYELHYEIQFSKLYDEKYAGVAILSKNKFKLVDPIFFHEILDYQSRIIAGNFGDFILVNIYSPTGTKTTSKNSQESLIEKLDFYRSLIESVKKLQNEMRPIILCGDFNIAHTDRDVYNPATRSKRQVGIRSEERALIDEILNFGFFDALRKQPKGAEQFSWLPSHKKLEYSNQGWRFDYFFVSNDLQEREIRSSIITGIRDRDHRPISLEWG